MPAKVRPITPEEACSGNHIPDEVFLAVNRLLSEKWDGKGQVRITQDEVIRGIQTEGDAAGKEITRQEIFAKGYLNFESAYAEAGWSVSYDKPGYNESYPATFVFLKGKK